MFYKKKYCPDDLTYNTTSEFVGIIVTLGKSSPTKCALVEELSNWYDYFLRLSGFLVFLFLAKYIWSTLNSPNLIFQEQLLLLLLLLLLILLIILLNAGLMQSSAVLPQFVIASLICNKVCPYL